MALATLVLAEESELNKRGVAKSPTINSLSNNGHQKPDQLNYANYKQNSPSTQAPLYPLAPSYTQEVQPQSVPHHPMFSFLPPQPQIVPVSLIQQPLAAPRYQLIAMKGSNGQMHLTLIPQNIYLGQQSYVSPPIVPVSQPLVSNHLNGHPQVQAAQQIQSAHSHTNYVTPQPQTHTTQSASAPLTTTQSAFYQPQYQPQYQQQYQHQSFNFAPSPLIGQPSTMFLYNQPAPQLYNNYAASGSNLLQSPLAQQLLSYYQSNPQAKNQLLYGNSPGYQQEQANSYTSLNTGEYVKAPSQAHPQQNVLSPKSENDISISASEFVSQPSEEPFRPVTSYGRSPPNYKN